MKPWPIAALALVAACRPSASGESATPPPPQPAATPEPGATVLSDEGVLGCIASEHDPTLAGGKLEAARARCGRFAGLPAISRDGRHAVVPLVLPMLLEGPAAPTVATLSLDVVRASDGKLLRSMPLVTAGDQQELVMPSGDCCAPNDDTCDPHLCEPSADGPEATESKVVQTIEDRLAAANAKLATMAYRPLSAVPTKRVAGRPLWFKLDDQGRASIHDTGSGRMIAGRDLSLRCLRKGCSIHSDLAWIDDVLSVVIVQVVTATEGSEGLIATVSYAAIQLPVPP